MSLTATASKLRDRYLTVLQDAVVGLKAGDDPELTLEALIEASELLTERLAVIQRGRRWVVIRRCPAAPRAGLGDRHHLAAQFAHRPVADHEDAQIRVFAEPFACRAAVVAGVILRLLPRQHDDPALDLA